MKFKLITFLIVSSFSLSFRAKASQDHHYYPESFQRLITKNSHSLKSETNLKEEIHKLLSLYHIKREGLPDQLSQHCSGENKSCYRQQRLRYREAREYLFGKLHLEEDRNGHYVQDVYCRKKIKGHGVGPMSVPDHNILNCEHTWPKSKFSNRYPEELQVSDLHHLFPTDMQANSKRGNYPFATVEGGSLKDCSSSRIGRPSAPGTYFEPPDEHKGNVARAIFYFSVRYEMEVSDLQEENLRRWHRLDPVDANEKQRNSAIYRIQHNRNPFIDYPELVSEVHNF